MTGVHSRSLSIPAEVTATDDAVPRLSAGCAGVYGVNERLVSLVVAVAGVLAAVAATVTVAGNCSAVKEKSLGRGGVQLLSSHA